jgi:hypothetical protein
MAASLGWLRRRESSDCHVTLISEASDAREWEDARAEIRRRRKRSLSDDAWQVLRCLATPGARQNASWQRQPRTSQGSSPRATRHRDNMCARRYGDFRLSPGQRTVASVIPPRMPSRTLARRSQVSRAKPSAGASYHQPTILFGRESMKESLDAACAGRSASKIAGGLCGAA